jgi:hypothetical protein
MATTSRSYAAGHFNLTLDGDSNAGYLKSVSGGEVKGAIVEEKIGPEYIQFKHLSTIEIEPVAMEVGMAVSRPLFGWIKASWSDSGFQRKNGSIIHGTFDQDAVIEQEFTDALISETVFPALDGSVKEPAYLTVKFQPETLVLKKSSGKLEGVIPATQKLWSPANFRLTIDGVETSQVNKIDSISVKQKIKSFHYGTNRHPELEPTGLEFSNITIYTALAHADQFIKWHDEYVVKGDKDTNQEKQGAIEFLDPTEDDQTPLFTIKLINLGIFALSIEKSEANADAIKRCKIQLYVERMDLEDGSGF